MTIYTGYQDSDPGISISLVSSPGRRRETLQAILHTLPGAARVWCADTVHEGICQLSDPHIDHVILDYNLAVSERQGALEQIRQLDHPVWILLLIAHPRDAFAFENPRPDRVLCDGFSAEDLIREIHHSNPLSFH